MEILLLIYWQQVIKSCKRISTIVGIKSSFILSLSNSNLVVFCITKLLIKRKGECCNFYSSIVCMYWVMRVMSLWDRFKSSYLKLPCIKQQLFIVYQLATTDWAQREKNFIYNNITQMQFYNLYFTKTFNLMLTRINLISSPVHSAGLTEEKSSVLSRLAKEWRGSMIPYIINYVSERKRVRSETDLW